MKFGTKSNDIGDIKKAIKAGTGGNTYIAYLKSGKDMKARFLTQPTEWLKYREHYSDATKFFPCTNDKNTCPGCTSDNEKMKRASTRYLANVLDVETSKVIPLKLPLDLANRLITRYERNNNDMTNRDYLLIRTGSDFNNTEYDCEQEDKSPLDVSRYANQLHDLESLLVASFEEAFGTIPTASPKASGWDDTVFDKDTTSDVDAGTVTMVPSVPGSTPMEQKKNLEESGAPAPTSAPVTHGGEPEADGEFISEDALRAMDHVSLGEVYIKAGVALPESYDKMTIDALVDILIAEAG